MYYIMIVAIAGVDQLVKYLVRTGMSLNETIPVIDGIFHITYIRNTGAAFSIFQGQRFFLILLPCILVLAVLVYMAKIRKKEHPLFITALALIAAGGLGNLIDRVWLGYVVDFLDLRVWPIFNIADISVCCGCGLILIYVLFIEGKKKKQDRV